MKPTLTELSKASRTMELVNAMVMGLVDYAGKVQITTDVWGENNDQHRVRVEVDPADLGKVIGKEGRTARSLRTILNGFAKREGIKVELDIRETPVQP